MAKKRWVACGATRCKACGTSPEEDTDSHMTVRAVGLCEECMKGTDWDDYHNIVAAEQTMAKARKLNHGRGVPLPPVVTDEECLEVEDFNPVQGHKKNFETLKRAIRFGDACIMQCTLKATGEKVAALCAVNREDGGFSTAPLAIFLNGNPYDMLEPVPSLEEMFYREVYKILMEEVGASEHDLEHFVQDQTSEMPAEEWRFSGSLGFGGKYWRKRNRVDCYQEDETPRRKERIEWANRRLKYLKEQQPK